MLRFGSFRVLRDDLRENVWTLHSGCLALSGQVYELEDGLSTDSTTTRQLFQED